MSPPDPRVADFVARVRPVGGVLRSYLRRILHRPEDADDVLQSTLLTALETHARVGPEGIGRSTLFKIATNQARNANRRRWRGATVKSVPDVESVDAQPVDEDLQAELVYERVLEDPDWVLARLQDPVSRALAELGDNERAAFILRAVAELPCAEVATILEVPKGTVLAWLHRARARLRRRLADHARANGWQVENR